MLKVIFLRFVGGCVNWTVSLIATALRLAGMLDQSVQTGCRANNAMEPAAPALSRVRRGSSRTLAGSIPAISFGENALHREKPNTGSYPREVQKTCATEWSRT